MLETIHNIVKNDLQLIDRFIVSQLEPSLALVTQILEYIMQCGGKRIRPTVLLLSTRALNQSEPKRIDVAAILELIHTATLLHDDVVDDATLRRGNKTAHMIWGSQASVLVGDFLYSRSFQLIVGIQHQTALQIFADATRFIAEGEILQLMNCRNAETTEEYYFEMIHRKTAKLFEISAELGAVLAQGSEQEVAAFKCYGKSLGLAYQLIDDVLDYSQSPDETGKNVGQDLAEGKVTLPLIHAIRQSKGAPLKLLKKAVNKSMPKNIDNILEIIETTGAIQYTAQSARRYAENAKSAISSIAPSPYHQALNDLCDFIVERTY